MTKILASLLVVFQKFAGLFDDDDGYDPSWMDAERWQLTRI